MDSYREHPSDFDVASASESSPSDEVAVGNRLGRAADARPRL